MKRTFWILRGVLWLKIVGALTAKREDRFTVSAAWAHMSTLADDEVLQGLSPSEAYREDASYA